MINIWDGANKKRLFQISKWVKGRGESRFKGAAHVPGRSSSSQLFLAALPQHGGSGAQVLRPMGTHGRHRPGSS